MRWSKLFVPTLRDAPADAEAASHKLLVRGGFMRQLHAGHYSMLTLGMRVHSKVAAIVRAEMDAIGAQEFQLPTMHPMGLWHKSGRSELMGDEMFRLADRKGTELALGVTEEEVFTTLALELSSYKQLPQHWYQIHTKFRDEPRPKSGLLRVREFTMKDSYSFDLDEAGLDASFDLHYDAYVRIFTRLGLSAMPVEASSGSMGGTESIEFMVPSPAGEDDVVRCPSCDYAANLERSVSVIPTVVDEAGPDAPVRFATPGVRTIAALEEIDGGAPAERQIKTMVMVLDDEVTLALLRGDHQLNLQKLQDATGAAEVRAATPEEALAAMGANPGSLGAVGVELRVIADPALAGRTNMTTGANDDDWHLRGVDVGRDISVSEFAELRDVSVGEGCPKCGTPVEIVRCIESGHIFKLGRKFTEAFDAKVLDPNGKAQHMIMGSYGIGIDRAVATIVETYHDDRGIVWPVAVAPFEAVITIASMKDEAGVAAAEKIYADLGAAGVDVVIDDRKARAGVKFADAELVGIPFRITIGKALADGEVEVTRRAGQITERVAVDSAVSWVVDAVQAAR
ncbi:MAG: proline--tRNA ligase [Actinobacteria bacterium]|nr:proline--tRNA ligase [Actinomycetota bacterium]